MALARSWFVKLAGICFCVGASMELFMIKTGFYNIVTEAEAQKWEEHREEREQRAAQLKQRLLEQYRQRGQTPPEALVTESP